MWCIICFILGIAEFFGLRFVKTRQLRAFMVGEVPRKNPCRLRYMLTLLIFCGVVLMSSTAQAADPFQKPFVWIESEAPTAFSGLEKLNSWEHKYFSGKWLHVSVDADKLETEVKGDTVSLIYEFDAKQLGAHEIWNRVGFEYVRSPFDWRIDDGDWKTAKPDDLTVDLMEVGFWCEIAWLKLGDIDLTPGKHKLEIRINKTKKPDGKFEKILYASDCICISSKPFSPYSKFKPDEDHRTDKDREAAKFVFSLSNSDARKIRFYLDKIQKLKLTLDEILTVIKEQKVVLTNPIEEKEILTYTIKSLGRFSSVDELCNTKLRVDDIGTIPLRAFAIIDIRHNDFVPIKSVLTRNEINLAGTWEICRDDELLPEPVTQPISRLPDTTRWSAIEVPGDKNELRPDLMFAHRIWYRTKVEIPDPYSGNGFFMEFPQNNLNTTVYVNGKLCGFEKNPFVKFQIDISKAIKSGVNEICVGIRDAWYARTEKADDPMKLRKTFNFPKSFFNQGFQDLVYPIWNHPQSGILVEPKIVSTGPIYISDLFVKTSVAKKQIDLDITVRNTTDQDIEKQIGLIVQEKGNTDINKHKTFGYDNLKIALKAGEEKTFTYSEPWTNPKLWTPQEPNLYELSAMIMDIEPPVVPNNHDVAQNGGPTDTLQILFGFREWSIEGKDFLLNGIPFHGRADCFEQPTPQKWLKFYHDTNQSVMRFWGVQWKNMPPEDALKFFDENGVAVRRSGIFDGEAIGYNAIENDPDIREKNKAADPTKEKIKMDLFRNWRDQMVAQVKGERNHPSIMLWSMENEILYINCINLYGDLMDAFEDEIVKTAAALKEADPTRPSMVDGGGATKSNRLEVHGDHYVVSDFIKYPDRAYEVTPEGGGHGNRWFWDEKRPRFIGEDFYVNGYKPDDFAAIGGEEAFGGRTAAKKSVGILYKMLTEGYRWNGYGAWQFWTDQNRAENQYGSNAPIAVFCKEYDWTFEAGQKVARTLKIFNDTMKDETITLTIGDGFSGKFSKEFFVSAGKSVEFPWSFVVPSPSAAKNSNCRDELQLVLTLSINNREVFQDVKDFSVLDPPHTPLRPGGSPPATTAPNDKDNLYSLLVYDPGKSTINWLDNRYVYKVIDSLENIPKGEYGKIILLIGKDALTPSSSETAGLRDFAAEGNSVIVLEQTHPLKLNGSGSNTDSDADSVKTRNPELASDTNLYPNEGRIGFIENESHPVFRMLKQKDFFTWPDGHVLYKNAWPKSNISDARSLLQCDKRLGCSAVVEIPVGKGVMILSQLLIGEKLEKSVVAKQLLGNMIQYGAEYRLNYVPVVVCTKDLDKRLLAELDTMNLKYTTVATPQTAIQMSTIHVEDKDKGKADDRPMKTTIILAATPENIKSLLEKKNEVDLLYNAGGTILLHGLTPDGITDFNKFVGVNHMIREFRRERVAFPSKKNLLTQGLSLADIAMSSGEKMFGWANDEYVASDTYGYVVDLEDVAPFAKYKNDFEQMMSNGMVSADGWPYIVNLPAPDQPPFDFSLKFPQEQVITEVVWTGNTFYYPVNQFQLFFDGKTKDAATFDVEPNNEPQTFSISPELRGKDLTLRLSKWTVIPDKNKVSGLDNIELKAKRSDDFHKKVKPLLNIGAMVRYEMNGSSQGGVVLCNLKFQDAEKVPINAVKKRNILATILRNLDAEFVTPTTKSGQN